MQVDSPIASVLGGVADEGGRHVLQDRLFLDLADQGQRLAMLFAATVFLAVAAIAAAVVGIIIRG